MTADTAARVAAILRDCAVQVMRTDCDYVRLSGRLFHAADALDAAADRNSCHGCASELDDDQCRRPHVEKASCWHKEAKP